MRSSSCFFVPCLLLILKMTAPVRGDAAPAQQYTLGAVGAPGCAFLLGAFGLLPKSRTADRGLLLPFLISNFYFLFSIFWFRVRGDSFPNLLVGAQHRCALLKRSAAL